MYFFYRFLTAVGMLFLAPYFAFRGWRRGEPARAFRERLGMVPPEITSRANPAGDAARSAIWIHAVSVGEVLAAQPLVSGLKHRFPERPVLVSTTTETGQRLARERMQCADAIFYFPLDWAVAVRRALTAIRPALVIVMETEIWPNFLREAQRRHIPVIFANGRISERSFARYQEVGIFDRRVFCASSSRSRTFPGANARRCRPPGANGRSAGADRSHRQSEIRRRATRRRRIRCVAGPADSPAGAVARGGRRERCRRGRRGSAGSI